MSVDPRDLRLRGERADNRNEAARLIRESVRAEERGARRANARWVRSIEPLMMTSSVPSDDFEGCVE